VAYGNPSKRKHQKTIEAAGATASPTRVRKLNTAVLPLLNGSIERLQELKHLFFVVTLKSLHRCCRLVSKKFCALVYLGLRDLALLNQWRLKGGKFGGQPNKSLSLNPHEQPKILYLRRVTCGCKNRISSGKAD